MPFTAKLSRRFYDHFGDELTNEFVDLINGMDATYKSELREMNELNFARFDAKLEQRMAELRTEIVALRAEMRAEMHAQKADLIKMDVPVLHRLGARERAAMPRATRQSRWHS